MKTNKILMVHGQELTLKRPRFDSLFPKESSFTKIEQARYGDLPGVGSDKDTVLGDPVPEEDADATDWCSVCSPHVGSAAAAKPATRNRQPV